jgi:Spy/CpxP family protein refolding chaperone
MRRVVIAMMLLALFAPAAVAQPANGPGPAGQNRRERIKKRIRALRAYTLTEELSLDEQAAAKLFPVLSKYDDQLEQLLITRADVMRRLRNVADLKDPKAIDKLIDEAVANQRGFWDVEDKRLTELRKILTPTQIARLVIVLPALERRIQNQLRKVVQGGGGGDGTGGDLGKNPFSDKDSDFGDDDDGLQPPGKTRPTKQPDKSDTRPRKSGPCDPFSNVHGCR